MFLISNRQLTGVYGTVTPGQEFNCPEDVAKELLRAGVAHKAEPPKVLYETKVVRPPEVGPTIPFRDMPVSDQKPEEVAAAGDHVLPAADIPKQGASDSGGRRGRLRFGGRK